jgi:hypothetical protein
MTRAQGLSDFASGLGDTLKIDASNNRVGINTTIPTEALEVVGVVSATSFYGSGANLTDVISGVELKQGGSSVGTSITSINFSGANVSTPTSGLSTVTIAVPTQLTIGMRVGSATTFSVSGSSFNVSGRSGAITIDI